MLEPVNLQDEVYMIYAFDTLLCGFGGQPVVKAEVDVADGRGAVAEVDKKPMTWKAKTSSRRASPTNS